MYYHTSVGYSHMKNEVKRSPNYISNFLFKWVRTQKNHGKTFFILWGSEVKGTTLLSEGLFVLFYFVLCIPLYSPLFFPLFHYHTKPQTHRKWWVGLYILNTTYVFSSSRLIFNSISYSITFTLGRSFQLNTNNPNHPSFT